MKLWRTTCSTDWKGRPDHKLDLIATDGVDKGDPEEMKRWIVERMDADVAIWQREDIATDKENAEEGEEVSDEWKNAGRREMNLAEPNDGHREFVLMNCDGETTTLVYHFFD